MEIITCFILDWIEATCLKTDKTPSDRNLQKLSVFPPSQTYYLTLLMNVYTVLCVYVRKFSMLPYKCPSASSQNSVNYCVLFSISILPVCYLVYIWVCTSKPVVNRVENRVSYGPEWRKQTWLILSPWARLASLFRLIGAKTRTEQFMAPGLERAEIEDGEACQKFHTNAYCIPVTFENGRFRGVLCHDRTLLTVHCVDLVGLNWAENVLEVCHLMETSGDVRAARKHIIIIITVLAEKPSCHFRNAIHKSRHNEGTEQLGLHRNLC